jgi:tRNA(His) 5'-end guanylyltransferase
MKSQVPERPGLIAEFETGPGQAVLPEVYVVLRLEGDRFGRLRADRRFGLDNPFDVRFTKWMLQVTSELMHAHGQVRMAFVGGDEISLLFGRGAEEFGPGGFRFGIRVASHASARLSLLFGDVATFGPRVYQLPSEEWVVRYFLWRHSVARSYAIDRYCRVTLARSGLDEAAARRVLAGLSDDEKLEVLTEHGFDFATTPVWQRRGTLVWRKPAGNGEPALVVDTELPEGDAYGEFLRRLAAPW